MSAIITEKFRQHNANQFNESFTETAGNAYYLFLAVQIILLNQKPTLK